MSNKVENTENNPKQEWTIGGNPQAIEAQEARGQEELIESLQLPKKCNSPRGLNASEVYHKMGIKTLTGSKGDDLFIGTKLPKGWKKESTDHAMWNNLIDDEGRNRASIFYKASFYDREAFINFNCRVNYRVDRVGFHNGNYETDEEYNYISKSTPFCGMVKDFDGTVLFKTDEIECEESFNYKDGKKHGYTEEYKEILSEVEDRLDAECKAYLEENYPDYKDVNAYWNLK